MEIGVDNIFVCSSEIRGNKQKLKNIIAAMGEVERVLIFVRQNPKRNILDGSGGTKKKRRDIFYVPWETRKQKWKTYNYYCYFLAEKTDLKKIIRLIQMKINSIHWIEIY